MKKILSYLVLLLAMLSAVPAQDSEAATKVKDHRSRAIVESGLQIGGHKGAGLDPR